MKKNESFFSVLFVPVDFVMVLLAGISAYHLRFSEWSSSIRPVVFNLPFSAYFRSVLLIAVLWTVIFIIAGLYQIKGARQLAQELRKIFFACSTGLAVIAIMIFFQRELFDSRFIVLAGWLFAVVYISFAHILIRFIQRRLYIFGVGVHKVILVGNSKTTDNLMAEFSSNKKAGFEVIKSQGFFFGNRSGNGRIHQRQRNR